MDDRFIELTQAAVTDLIYQFSGQRRILTIPRAYLDWLDGDHVAALMLSQILYWSERTRDQDGWFYKSAKDWQEELAISTYQQKRAVKKLEQCGVETDVRKANGAPTVHFRLSRPVFSKWIWEKLANRESLIREKLTNPFLDGSENDSSETHESLPTEITSDITQRNGTENISRLVDGMPAHSVWGAVLDDIASTGEIKPTDLDGFVRPAKLLGSKLDGTLVLHATTAPAQRRIEAHLKTNIERAIGRWLGRPIKIEVTG